MRLSKTEADIVLQVKMLLEKEYKYQHTQASLARRFLINESKLRVAFSSAYGITIYKYQISIRIETAKRLLADTDDTVKSIASQVGYDVKSLEKQFKKITGITPLKWRLANSSHRLAY